jgi:hypothetical protein
LELVKKLPVLPHTTCTHTDLHVGDTVSGKTWRCHRLNCNMLWDHEPQPFELGETAEKFHERKYQEWRKANGL